MPSSGAPLSAMSSIAAWIGVSEVMQRDGSADVEQSLPVGRKVKTKPPRTNIGSPKAFAVSAGSLSVVAGAVSPVEPSLLALPADPASAADGSVCPLSAGGWPPSVLAVGVAVVAVGAAVLVLAVEFSVLGVAVSVLAVEVSVLAVEVSVLAVEVSVLAVEVSVLA